MSIRSHLSFISSSKMRLNQFILLIVFLVVQSVLAIRSSSPSSTGSGPIVFPNSQRRPSAPNTFDSVLIRTAGVRNASEFLAALGIRPDNVENDDPISARKGKNYAEQAVCEPEMRTVEVGNQGIEAGEVVFPRCVRVQRCGGCCDITDRMACTPTKISYQEVKRARIRIRRSTQPSARQQTVQVEVHEECRCMCKVKEEHCNLAIHVYQTNLCTCVCKNQKEAIECKNMAPLKTWDNDDCKCKCREVKHCPSGTNFSQETCSCEAS